MQIAREPSARSGGAYAACMSNVNDALEPSPDGIPAVRLAERAGSEYLGASLYELQPGQETVFHYHLQREELLIVLAGRVDLRTPPAGRKSAMATLWLFPEASAARTATATTATLPPAS
jgi:hypothetical protein